MPCYTNPHGECRHQNNDIEDSMCVIRKQLENLSNDKQYYKQTSDEATKLLCELCKELEKTNNFNFFSQELNIWYLNHKKFDQERNK